MAERKATNKYYPPDWDPRKGSINTYRGSHPLRERARKLDQGILIIRFELPFNIWCDGCNNHVGMGVRYNAEKSKVGMFHTTPIYKFRMKCHLCDNHFEIQTDPENLDYVVINGARRQERRWSPGENEQVEVDKQVKQRISLDPMFKLEHEVIDKQKAISNNSSIENLEQFQTRWKDDYSINCALRKTFRNNKKELKEVASNDAKLLQKSSLPFTLKLVSERETDCKMAKLINLQSSESSEFIKNKKRKQIMNQSIFGGSSLSSNLKFELASTSRKNNTNSKTKPICKKVIVKRNPTSIVDYSSDSD